MKGEDALETIKERLSTLRWELIERSGMVSRSNYPGSEELDVLWKEHVDGLMAEVPYYDYELEAHTKYREKGVTLPDEAFSFLKNLNPSCENAFLFRGNGRWIRKS